MKIYLSKSNRSCDIPSSFYSPGVLESECIHTLKPQVAALFLLCLPWQVLGCISRERGADAPTERLCSSSPTFAEGPRCAGHHCMLETRQLFCRLPRGLQFTRIPQCLLTWEQLPTYNVFSDSPLHKRQLHRRPQIKMNYSYALC